MNLKEIRENIATQKERIEFYQSEILRLFKNLENGEVKRENINKLYESVDDLNRLKFFAENRLTKYLIMESREV
ncbi:hypothetical protein LMHOCYYV_CDS0017 [Staphylococcus phage PG-2021_4]